jgi:hypothetical protein
MSELLNSLYKKPDSLKTFFLCHTLPGFSYWRYPRAAFSRETCILLLSPWPAAAASQLHPYNQHKYYYNNRWQVKGLYGTNRRVDELE